MDIFSHHSKALQAKHSLGSSLFNKKRIAYNLPPDKQHITLSPALIIEKSAIAWPASRRRRFCNLFCSDFCERSYSELEVVLVLEAIRSGISIVFIGEVVVRLYASHHLRDRTLTWIC